MLELGCGTGRIADALATLGHEVTGVDLARRFDAVVLASHLVNIHDHAQRMAFLAAARRHLDRGGTLVLQRYPPDHRPRPHAWSAGPVELELRVVVEHAAGVFSATLVHRLGGLGAEQDFSAHVLDDAALRRTLHVAGFGRPENLRQALTPGGRWLRATAT